MAAPGPASVPVPVMVFSTDRWQKLLWPVVLTVLVATFAIGAWPTDKGPRDNDARVEHLAEQVRCPTCAGLSVADSQASLAVSAKQEIEQQVSQGRSDDAILDFFVSRYGDNALVAPPRTGMAAMVWTLPVVVGLVLLAGVVVIVRRWRSSTEQRREPTAEERELVTRALEGRT